MTVAEKSIKVYGREDIKCQVVSRNREIKSSMQ